MSTKKFSFLGPDYQLEVERCTTWENPDAPWMTTFVTYVVFLISCSTVSGWKLTFSVMIFIDTRRRAGGNKGLSIDHLNSNHLVHDTGLTSSAATTFLTG
jgi:hypothetical protein